MKSVIVDTDTLRAIGLRAMLERFGGLEPIITTDPTTLCPLDDSTLFFVTPEAFASMPMFYVPRRQQVVLIMDSTDSPLPVLPPHISENELEERLENILGTMKVPGRTVALTDRERQVLALAARGLINKEIADRLEISLNTVLTHRKNISAKLGIKSVAALSVYAMMNGLVD